jgi:hypothetical protein
MTRLSPVSALWKLIFAPSTTAIALLTDLGIFVALFGFPRRSRKPLRNKGISRFGRVDRRGVALSTSGDE